MAEPTLRDELTQLRIVVARRLREKLESPEGATPSWIDVARKFLSDQDSVLTEPPERPLQPSVVSDLPFVGNPDTE